jgi:hypothetical protein
VCSSDLLWLHNIGVRNNYYGRQYNRRITIISNKNPDTEKEFKGISEQASSVWDCGMQGDIHSPANTSYPRGQTSILRRGTFTDKEGQLYTAFGKNMTTHQLLPTVDDFINGDDLRGTFMEITLHNTDTDESPLFSVEIIANESKV